MNAPIGQDPPEEREPEPHWFGHHMKPESELSPERDPMYSGVEGEVPNDGETTIHPLDPAPRKFSQAERQEAIRLLRFYYAIGYNEAQRKLRELNNSGELDVIIDQARQGMKTHRPICPRCNSEMVKRNGRLGEFWGCPNFPNCTGTRQIISEIKAVTEAQKAEAAAKMTLALEYVNAIGGIDEARRWVNIAGVSLGEGKVSE